MTERARRQPRKTEGCTMLAFASRGLLETETSIRARRWPQEVLAGGKSVKIPGIDCGTTGTASRATICFAGLMLLALLLRLLQVCNRQGVRLDGPAEFHAVVCFDPERLSRVRLVEGDGEVNRGEVRRIVAGGN